MKKKITFFVDESLWKKFDSKCVERNDMASELLEKFVWGYADPNGYQIHLLNEKQRKRAEKYSDFYELNSGDKRIICEDAEENKLEYDDLKGLIRRCHKRIVEG